MNTEQFRALALSFHNTLQAPHFDRTAFKVTGKRIFATLQESSSTANLKLPPADQSVFCLIDKTIIYPVANKWGLQGWTTFELINIDPELMLDALATAYNNVLTTKK